MVTENPIPKRIAVVGAGISGITAAHVLSRFHDVTLFEKNGYIGGHTNTRTIESGPDAGLAVDTGFIVCNPKNYPNFYRFLSELKVPLQDSDMSFGFYSERSKLQYMGPAIRDFLAEPKNLLNPQFLAMVWEQQRFNSRLLKELHAGTLENESLREYLERNRVGSFFIDHYLVPLIASIWSCPDGTALDFPVATFARFFENHGMLELSKRPQWQTVVGGSHSYVKAFAAKFKGTLSAARPVHSILRTGTGVTLRHGDGATQNFDAVVLAAHADESLRMLEDASAEERALLERWNYNRSTAFLHTDASVLPGRKALWASWNYCLRADRDGSRPVAITYYMNRLQRLKAKSDYFVTLNPDTPIDPAKVIYHVEYTHPVYTPDSVKSQNALRTYSGSRNTYFCGAYLGYGFHEDGIRSGLDVAAAFGLTL